MQILKGERINLETGEQEVFEFEVDEGQLQGDGSEE